MRHFHLAKNKYICPSVNVDQLWHLAGGEEAVKQAEGNKDATKALMLDVTKLGFFKVLGKGRLPGTLPLIVKARFISKSAEAKIKEAGGSVVLTA
jgi:large subunit ribosomal protein L27Ae